MRSMQHMRWISVPDVRESRCAGGRSGPGASVSECDVIDRFVERLETTASGREVSKVIVRRNGVREEYSADVVVTSCGAINSAALLLRSANEKHPNGLANGCGGVGRHYMGHINSVLMAISKCPNPTTFQKTLSVNDFYLGSDDWEFPMGHISFVGKFDGETLKAGARDRSRFHARPDGESLTGFLADIRRSAG